jgi:DNA (cytosine-5)-methyltransferase 1
VEVPAVSNSLRPPSNGASWRGDGADTLVPAVAGALGSSYAKGNFRMDLDGHGAYIPEVSYALAAGQGGSKHGSGRDGQDSFIAFTQNQRDEVRGLGDLATSLSAAGGSKTEVRLAVALASRTRDGAKQLEVQEDLAYALNNPGDGGRADERTILTPTLAVRRLTPVECERLMGFADGWTAYEADGTPVADSVRYRMLGNSVVVPLVTWLARRMRHALEGTAP